MNSIKINDINYNIIKDEKHILEEMDISEKLTEYFDNFDYIVGDLSYGLIRLKGFYQDSRATLESNKISNLQNYLDKYCSYGCKWFIISQKYKE